MDFFEQFDDASWEFTIGDHHEPEKNVLQAGLVGVFFIEMGQSLADKRYGMRHVIERYCQLYGDNLRWGIVHDSNSNTSYDYEGQREAADYLDIVTQQMDAAMMLKWMSGPGDSYADSELISVYSDADWYQKVHRTMSSICFFLPIERLKGGGKSTFERFLTEICDAVQPLHGYAGLGVQGSNEQYNYQHLEFGIARDFLGLDAAPRMSFLLAEEFLKAGFKTINWYTFLDKKWVDQLGGVEQLRSQLDDPRIVFLPNRHGLGIRAGDWPELGWVQRNPYPELYVKVNGALEPVRAPEVGGFAFGSIGGETRFTHETSNLWMRRFDAPGIWPPPWLQSGSDASQVPAVLAAVPTPSEESDTDSANQERVLPVHAGQPCPRTGWWLARALSARREFVEVGEVMPGPAASAGGNQVIWYWLGMTQQN
ncbi:type VI immunity family protein [Cupriavidus sp. 2SB]|uniref:type VI immunity family protein n=1 Tax=Cupriavidus sp. 2SB TaxID=2502199 RepID=UPI0010F68ECD|nr:type VI immunity family protein [Cupriavidus sp. 2SB]